MDVLLKGPETVPTRSNGYCLNLLGFKHATPALVASTHVRAGNGNDFGCFFSRSGESGGAGAQ
eukprot:364174-Amphidinium_carterae.2